MSNNGNYPRICFVSHFSYDALTGSGSGNIGGVQRQTSLMAKWFAARGYPVSMLTCDEGQEDGEEIDGVRVFKMYRRGSGIRGLRFFWPHWTSLVAAMRRADADIYYHNLGECVTGQVAFWCRRNGRRFIFSASSEGQCKEKLPYRVQERILYRYGLKAADVVIVQTMRQQSMMWENFGRDSVVLPMPCPKPNEACHKDSEPKRDNPLRVLWIGRICEIKRPDRLLDLAQACPDLSFDLVGPVDGTGYARDVCRRAETVANVTLHGPATWDRVSEFYRRADVLCCTSDSEGFPNTFLEAWSRALPTVSTFDPDDLVAEKGLGIVAQDVMGLARGIRSLCKSPDQRREMGQRARQYFLKNHALDVAMARFERVFLDSHVRQVN